MGSDERRRGKTSERVQMKQRKAKSHCTAMGFYCFCGSGESECFNQGGSTSLEPARGGAEVSPKEPQTQQDYEDLISQLGGETRWLRIESQD